MCVYFFLPNWNNKTKHFDRRTYIGQISWRSWIKIKGMNIRKTHNHEIWDKIICGQSVFTNWLASPHHPVLFKLCFRWSEKLTIFPLSGCRVQVSKQLVCCHSFGVDVTPDRFHLHVCVGSVQSLQDLVNEMASGRFKNLFPQNLEMCLYRTIGRQVIAVALWTQTQSLLRSPPGSFQFLVPLRQTQSVWLPEVPPAGSPAVTHTWLITLTKHHIIAKWAAESPGLFSKTRDLQHEVLLWLQVELCDWLANSSLQLRVSLSWHVQLREKVTDESQEYRHVTGHNLGEVEVP